MDSYNDTIRSLEAFKGRLTKGLSDAKDQIQISEDTINRLGEDNKAALRRYQAGYIAENVRHTDTLKALERKRDDELTKIQTSKDQHENLIHLQEIQIANMEHELREVEDLIEKTKLAASKQGK